MATDVSTAKFDTLEEFTQCYTPGTANRITASGQPLWMVALTNKNPENRYAIVSYLLDDGGDPAGTNEDGGNGLHILFGRYDHRGVPTTDVALVELSVEQYEGYVGGFRQVGVTLPDHPGAP